MRRTNPSLTRRGRSPHRIGPLPPAVVLTPGPGRVLSFASVSGSVSYNDVDAPLAYLGQYNGPNASRLAAA